MSKRTWIGLLVLAGVGLAALALPGSGPASGQSMMGPGGMGQGGMGQGGMGGGMGPGMGGGAGAGPNAGSELKNPVPSTSESIARGKAVFQAQCAACHGPEGLGNGPAAGSLNPRPANLRALAGGRPDGNLFFTITNGRGVMPTFKDSLTETQRWDVVNFVKSLAY